MKRVIAVIALSLGATISACGGDSSTPITPVQTTSTPVQPLTKDAFIKEADGNCDDAYTSLANVASSTSSSDLESQVSEKKNIVDGLVEQLKGLPAPTQDQQTLNQFIDDLDKASKALDKQELAAKRGDTTATDSAGTEFDSAMSDARSAASDYGFKKCSKEGTASSSGGGGTTTTPSTPSAPVTPAPAPAPVPAPAPAPPAGGGSSGGGGGISP